MELIYAVPVWVVQLLAESNMRQNHKSESENQLNHLQFSDTLCMNTWRLLGTYFEEHALRYMLTGFATTHDALLKMIGYRSSLGIW